MHPANPSSSSNGFSMESLLRVPDTKENQQTTPKNSIENQSIFPKSWPTTVQQPFAIHPLHRHLLLRPISFVANPFWWYPAPPRHPLTVSEKPSVAAADEPKKLLSSCKMCGKSFTRHWLLQGHLRTHTGERPFKCATCQKSFADKSNLRAHLQTHSAVKPHACTSCGKRFALKSYLSKHRDSSCHLRRQNQRDNKQKK